MEQEGEANVVGQEVRCGGWRVVEGMDPTFSLAFLRKSPATIPSIPSIPSILSTTKRKNNIK